MAAPATSSTTSKVLMGIGGLVVLTAIVLALVFGAKGCSKAGTANDRISRVEKKVDDGFEAIRTGLKSPKKDKTEVADPAPDPKPVAASDPAPRRTYTRTSTSTTSSGSSDHEKRITNLETWRKNRVDPALDRWDEAAKKLEAIGVKGVD